jgi:hypothetical protein
MSKYTLKSKIDLINRDLADMGIKPRGEKVEIRILISSIVSVRQVIDDDDIEINHDKCSVYLTSGEFFELYTPYEEVIKILEWY